MCIHAYIYIYIYIYIYLYIYIYRVNPTLNPCLSIEYTASAYDVEL